MVSAFRRRVLAAVALGVALPSLVLAALGVMLTLRIERSLLNDAVRYNSYLAQLVGESFENELQAHLQQEIQGAESTARAGLPVEDVRRALADAGPEFLGSHFVPFEDIGDYATWPIQGSVVFYAEGAGRHRGHEFYGLLLRDARHSFIPIARPEIVTGKPTIGMHQAARPMIPRIRDPIAFPLADAEDGCGRAPTGAPQAEQNMFPGDDGI